MLKTVSSITNAIGALNYKGTWDANANTPTLASGVGVKGDYYQVGVAGSTTIDGISNWGVGDVIAFNGVTWQRLEGGADLNGVNLSVSGDTTLSGLTASRALALDANKKVVDVPNTGTGDNVLATSPTLITPNIGAATATSLSYGSRGGVSQIRSGGSGPATLTLFTFDLDTSFTYGTVMVEVQFVAQQETVLPGFATEARKYIFALRRNNSNLAASTINSSADSSYSVSNLNYTMTLTPSVNVVSGSQAQFQVQVASTGAINIGGFRWAAQAQAIGVRAVTVS